MWRIQLGGVAAGAKVEHLNTFDHRPHMKETFLTPSPYSRWLPSFSHIDLQSSPHCGHIASLQHNCIIQAMHIHSWPQPPNITTDATVTPD